MQSNTHLQDIYQLLNLIFQFLSVVTWHSYNIVTCTKVTQLVCTCTIQKLSLWICFSYQLAQTLVYYLSNNLLHLFVCSYINMLHPLTSCKSYFAHLQENLLPPSGVAVPTHEVSVRDHLNWLDGIKKHILDVWILLFWSNLCSETNRVWMTKFVGAFSRFSQCQRLGP